MAQASGPSDRPHRHHASLSSGSPLVEKVAGKVKTLLALANLSLGRALPAEGAHHFGQSAVRWPPLKSDCLPCSADMRQGTPSMLDDTPRILDDTPVVVDDVLNHRADEIPLDEPPVQRLCHDVIASDRALHCLEIAAPASPYAMTPSVGHAVSPVTSAVPGSGAASLAPLVGQVAVEMKQLLALSNLNLPLGRRSYHDLPADGADFFSHNRRVYATRAQKNYWTLVPALKRPSRASAPRQRLSTRRTPG
jgi:hypothetical protein